MEKNNYITLLKKRIEALEKQIQLLDLNEEFKPQSFDVWVIPEWAKDESVEIIKNGWDWGHCRSRTCNCVSHDPYSEGDTVVLLCRSIGGNNYVTKQGTVFTYIYKSNGHYSPTAKMFIVKEDNI